MAKTYTPNPNRQVIGGRVNVTAEELADFKRQYGQDKTLRDLLNMDKGLTRRGTLAEGPADESGRFRSRRADDDSMRYRGERSYVPTPAKPQGPTPEQLAQYEEMMRPGRDALEGVYPEAALIPAAKGAEKLARAGLGALRGAMARKEAAKEAAKPRRSEPTMRGDESLSPGKPGRSDPYMRGDDEFAPIRSGRTEPEFKKGGAVRASRGDGICKRGHTKGRMV